MRNDIEYLEKYTVAPSPSRDYYGLKVLHNKVILYIWKISHGPHKIPLIRTSNFSDFEQDKQLQEEIRRNFGKYLLKHVRNIASGRRKTLLTLPKILIGRLVKYLSVNDIVNLTTLSHVTKEIFDDNFIWEILYNRYMLLTNKNDKLSSSCDWKQLFQQAQIQGLMNEHKVSRSRQPSKQTKTNSKVENLLKVANVPLKGTSRSVPSTNQATKKSSEDVWRVIPNSITRKVSDFRLERLTIENQIVDEKRAPPTKSLQTSGQKTTKRTQNQSKVLTKPESNRETNDNRAFVGKLTTEKSDRRQTRARRTNTKHDMKSVSSSSVRTMVERPGFDKAKDLTHVNSTITEKSTLWSMQSHRSKGKKKTKKIGQSKSMSLSTNMSQVDDQFAIRDDSFNFADLIDASLKSIRNSNSMLDYNSVCIDRPKSCGGDGKDASKKTKELPRVLKSGCGRKMLDRLSEKSEPLTAKSIYSDISSWSDFSSNSKTLKEKAKNETQSNKVRSKAEIDEDKLDCSERYNLCNKKAALKINSTEHRAVNSKKLLDKMAVLRSLGSNSTCGRSSENSTLTNINRYEFRKPVNSMYKH
ncbi:uncharacterized protein LOC116428821 [Nomia melanderi]|uniref:uncharacterized protein LOC116428821 n=1 Tax=Nomia melanderi TaxID=2448451 RepID=UPI001304205C|nr:uncharacterized protein LOC116428821 [Nomia melanderi]